MGWRWDEGNIMRTWPLKGLLRHFCDMVKSKGGKTLNGSLFHWEAIHLRGLKVDSHLCFTITLLQHSYPLVPLYWPHLVPPMYEIKSLLLSPSYSIFHLQTDSKHLLLFFAFPYITLRIISDSQYCSEYDQKCVWRLFRCRNKPSALYPFPHTMCPMY